MKTFHNIWHEMHPYEMYELQDPPDMPKHIPAKEANSQSAPTLSFQAPRPTPVCCDALLAALYNAVPAAWRWRTARRCAPPGPAADNASLPWPPPTPGGSDPHFH